ncbi:MAG: hypothetical protein HC782_05835 [Gammaproteobacteria bacterium]|nr:hypothetical protein [Gammaproteobacteria bacterium]
MKWFDFQANALLVNNLAHYTDIYHFSPAISREIIEAIAGNKYRLTTETLKTNNAWLRETALKTDARGRNRDG